MLRQTQLNQRGATRGASDVLVVFYGLWAFSAFGRAVYQYLFKHPATFVPTHISTFVGALYVLIIMGLRRRSPQAWWVTLALLIVELAGVLIVGTIDVIWRPFPYATVWSNYGMGYFFMPLILPFAGLAWLLKRETRRAYGVREGSQRRAFPSEPPQDNALERGEPEGGRPL